MRSTTLTLLIVSVFSCKKQPKEDCSTYNISPSDLANLYFKTNSYWIYFDSIPLNYDSAYVVSNYTEYYGMSHTCAKYQANHFTLKHSLLPSFAETINITSEGCSLNYTKIYAAFNSTEYETGKYTRTFYDSLFIYDRYYKKVEKTIVTNDQNESNNKSVYYINSDYGVLRKDIYDSGNNPLSKKFLIRKTVLK